MQSNLFDYIKLNFKLKYIEVNNIVDLYKKWKPLLKFQQRQLMRQNKKNQVWLNYICYNKNIQK